MCIVQPQNLCSAQAIVYQDRRGTSRSRNRKKKLSYKQTSLSHSYFKTGSLIIIILNYLTGCEPKDDAMGTVLSSTYIPDYLLNEAQGIWSCISQGGNYALELAEVERNAVYESAECCGGNSS